LNKKKLETLNGGKVLSDSLEEVFGAAACLDYCKIHPKLGGRFMTLPFSRCWMG
jgi:hypothetical protein